MPIVRMPDGVQVNFPDHFTEQQIRGLIASKFPRAVGEATLAAGKTEDPAGHPEFVAPPTVSPAEDVLRGGRTGLRDAAEGTAGMYGDVPKLTTGIYSWVAEKLGASPEYMDRIRKSGEMFDQANFLPSTEDIHSATSDVVGPSYEPQTEAGKVARTAGQFAPIALAPGSINQRALSLLGAVGGKEGGERAASALGFENAAPYIGMAGAVLGGGLPAIAQNRRLIGEAAKDIGVKGRDLTRIIKRLQADGFTPEQIKERMNKLGPEGIFMDAGPNMRQEGQQIIAKGGEGRATLTNRLTEREAGATERLTAAREQFGPAISPQRFEAANKADKQGLGPFYDEVHSNGRAVDLSPLANDIDSAIVNAKGAARAKLEEVRKMLNVYGTDQLDPHPGALHETRKALDGMMTGEMDGNVKAALSGIRQSIDNELAAKVPGIKEVDARFAELSRQKEGFDAGRQVLRSGDNTQWPEDFAQDFAQSANPKGLMIGPSAQPFRTQQGIVSDLAQTMGTNANDRVALQRVVKGEGDWNRDKLRTAFPEKADKFLDTIEQEKEYFLTYNKGVHNSKTAETMAPPSGFGGLDAYKAGGVMGAVRSAAVSIGEKALDKVRGQAASARDANVAKLLSSKDRDKIVTALMKANGGKSVGQRQIEQAARMLLLVPGASAQFGQ